MRHRVTSFLASACLLLASAGVPACGAENGASSPCDGDDCHEELDESELCEPDSIVSCECPDGETGQATCASDGLSHDDCHCPDEALDIGASCPLGCVGTSNCVSTTEDCGTGLCTFDGTSAYCTIGCEDECPSGYACYDTVALDGAPARVCWHSAGTRAETATFSLGIAGEIDGEAEGVQVDGDMPIETTSSASFGCGEVVRMGSTPWADHTRRWYWITPCVDLHPLVRDLRLDVRIPIPATNDSATYDGLQWSVVGHFASSSSDTNNYWEFRTSLEMTLDEVERADGQVRVSGSVDLTAPSHTCASPEPDECERLGESMTVEGTFSFLLDDPY